jgi:hypothetical protein
MIAIILAAVLCTAAVLYLFWMLQASDRVTAAKLNAATKEATGVPASRSEPPR